MGHRVRLRLVLAVGVAVVLAVVVLYPPWLVVLVTPRGAVPLRVEFSFLLGDGPQPASGGMYPQRSTVRVDWLALEIAVVVVGGALLLLVPKRTGRPRRAGASAVPGAAPATRGAGAERTPPTEYQSSPGEPFEQHAARLERVWRTPVPERTASGPAEEVDPEGVAPPVPGPAPVHEGGAVEPEGEYQSSPGEPFDQHAERLRRVWRPRGRPRGAKTPEGER
jgi:hypothetical protein